MTTKNMLELCKRAKLIYAADKECAEFDSTVSPLEKLIALVIEDCAIAAEEHARSYSEIEPGIGAKGAANAVRRYASTLLK